MTQHQCEEWQMQESATGRGKYCAECGRHTDQDLLDRSLTDTPPADGDPQESGAAVVDWRFTIDLSALRKIAERATEGPWRIYTVTDSGGRSSAVETAWAHDEQGEDTELVTDWCAPEDAAHIVAFDPPTVLALIARTDTAEAKVAAVRELHAKRIPTARDHSTVHCDHCGTGYAPSYRYPCPTIAALDGTA